MNGTDPYSDGANDQYEGGEQFDDRSGDLASTEGTAPWGGGWGIGRSVGRSHDAKGASDAELVEAQTGDQRGLFSLLALVGVVLVLVPEPATSLLGVGFLLAAGIGWLVSR